MDEGLLVRISDQPVSDNPISRYNYFIEIYNQESNKVDGVSLLPMSESVYFSTVWGLLKPTWVKVRLLRRCR